MAEEDPTTKGPPTKKQRAGKSVELIEFPITLETLPDPQDDTKTIEHKVVHAHLCPINNCFDVFKTTQTLRRHLFGVLATGKQFVPGYVSFIHNMSNFLGDP